MEEFEIKFLEVNVPELEKKLVSIGAEKVEDLNYERVLMDYPDFRLNTNHSWVRIRTDGKKTTLTYKQAIKNPEDREGNDLGMTEIEVGVEDYKKTLELLKSIGLIVKREEKNKRIRYKKGENVFDIDIWPGIPPYLEVEGNSLESAQKAADELGFNGKEGLICSAGKVYKKYGIEVHDYYSITFEGMVKK